MGGCVHLSDHKPRHRTFASVFWMRLRRTRNVFRPGPESWPSGPDQGTSEIHIHRIAMLCFWQHFSNIQPPTHRCTYYSALWTSHIRNMFQKSSSPSGQRFQLTVSAYENEGLLSQAMQSMHQCIRTIRNTSSPIILSATRESKKR